MELTYFINFFEKDLLPYLSNVDLFILSQACRMLRNIYSDKLREMKEWIDKRATAYEFIVDYDLNKIYLSGQSSNNYLTIDGFNYTKENILRAIKFFRLELNDGDYVTLIPNRKFSNSYLYYFDGKLYESLTEIDMANQYSPYYWKSCDKRTYFGYRKYYFQSIGENIEIFTGIGFRLFARLKPKIEEKHKLRGYHYFISRFDGGLTLERIFVLKKQND